MLSSEADPILAAGRPFRAGGCLTRPASAALIRPAWRTLKEARMAIHHLGLRIQLRFPDSCRSFTTTALIRLLFTTPDRQLQYCEWMRHPTTDIFLKPTDDPLFTPDNPCPTRTSAAARHQGSSFCTFAIAHDDNLINTR